MIVVLNNTMKMMKNLHKEIAIKLRKEGKSYNEILKEVHVAKSTLSLWLRSVGLSKMQKQRLTDKKRASIERGWKAWNQIRVEKTKSLIQKARDEVYFMTLDKNTLLLIGVALYWAEGSKEKEYKPGQGVVFSNSDRYMVKFFAMWIRDILQIQKERIYYDIYLHESYKNRKDKIIAYWRAELDEFTNNFGKIYYKKHNITSKRRNSGNTYFGLVRLRITKSSNITRRIAGLVEGICAKCGVV